MARRISEILAVLASGEDGQKSNFDIFAEIFEGVDQRLAAIENVASSVAALQSLLETSAQSIVDAALDPVVSSIAAKADLGAILTATSVDVASVGLGLKTFVIAPEASRPMYAPAHMLSIVATDDPTICMYARRVSYDVSTGVLTVDVLATTGSGTLTSWTIAPGSLASMANALTIAAVSEDIVGPTLHAGLEQIVAVLAGKQPLAGNLTALAALSLAADRVVGTGADGGPTQFPVSTYGKALLIAPSAEELRSSLGAAPAASPALTGTPTAPTASVSADSNQIANVTAVRAAIAALVNSSPAALDTLKELATALGNDANFAATMTTALAGKQPSDATLTALAALNMVADRLIYATGSDAFALTAFTSFARSLLDDADASAARTTLGLGTSATVNTGTSGATIPLLSGANTWSAQQTFSINPRIINSDPRFTFTDTDTNVQHQISGGSGVGSFTVLVDQNSLGSAPVFAAYIQGTQRLAISSTTATFSTNLALDTNMSISFAGTGAATTRTNLGLGTAATQNTGTSGSNVPLLNAGNTWSGVQTFTANQGMVLNASSPTFRLIDADTGVEAHLSASSSVGSVGLNADVNSVGSSPNLNFDIRSVNKLSINETSATIRVDVALTTDKAISFSGTGAATTRTNLGLAAIAASGSAADLTSGLLPMARIPHMIGSASADGYVRLNNSLSGDGSVGGSVGLAASGDFYYTYDGAQKWWVNTTGTLTIGIVPAARVTGLGDLATQNQVDLGYSGSSAANTTFPVGEVIAVTGISPNRNASNGVWLSTANSIDFVGAADGAQLAGTWRARGRPATGNSNMRRVG